MNSEEILKTCIRELKRCSISFLLIIIGVFLATQNAPAAVPNQNQCMSSMEMINALASRPLKTGTRTLVQPVGNSLHRIHTKQTIRKCLGNLIENKTGR